MGSNLALIYLVALKLLNFRYANDIIAKCVYGVSIDSLKDPVNEFYKMSMSSTEFSLMTQLKFLATSALPMFSKVGL